MALEFSQCYHTMTFKGQYIKNRIKFLTVPFYTLASFSELLMKPSLNSSYYAINDVDIFITKHSCDTIGCGSENYVYLTTAEDQRQDLLIFFTRYNLNYFIQ